jgi:hypothetical protein
MTAKVIISILWFFFLTSPDAMAEKPDMFRTVVSLQVLCTKGSPELLMKQLLDDYNEKPVHAIDLSSTMSQKTRITQAVPLYCITLVLPQAVYSGRLKTT